MHEREREWPTPCVKSARVGLSGSGLDQQASGVLRWRRDVHTTRHQDSIAVLTMASSDCPCSHASKPRMPMPHIMNEVKQGGEARRAGVCEWAIAPSPIQPTAAAVPPQPHPSDDALAVLPSLRPPINASTTSTALWHRSCFSKARATTCVAEINPTNPCVVVAIR